MAAITVQGVELTQAIQFFDLNGQGSGLAPDNSVGLVSGRTTIVRVYAAVPPLPPPPPRQPPARRVPLTARLTYQPLGGPPSSRRTIGPLQPRVEARTAAELDRGDVFGSLNFLIPAGDCHDTLRLTTTVRQERPEGDPDLTAVTATVDAAFTPVPTFRLVPVLVRYTGNGQDLPAPTPADFARVLGTAQQMFPIVGLEIGDCVEYTYDGDLSVPPGPGCGPGWADLLDLLEEMRPEGDDAVYAALLSKDVISGSGNGCGSRRGLAAATLDSERSFVHELGHALGRRHAPCGDPNDPDPDFPDYGDGQPASIGEYGVKLSNVAVVDPAFSADIMSYCRRSQRWVSPYTYEGFRAGMVDRWASPRAAAAPVEIFHLRCDVTDDAVSIRSVFRRTGPPPITTGHPTGVTVDLVDIHDQVLATHRCGLVDPNQVPTDPRLSFSETLPWAPGTHRLVFRRDGRLIGRHELDDARQIAAIPTAPRFDPDTGLLTWDTPTRETPAAAVAPGRYQVDYTGDDGATWQVLAHPRQPRCTVDLRRLAGGERCRLRVSVRHSMVPSGVETASFSVPAKPRAAYLLEPRRGHRVDGRHVHLVGGGFAPGQGLADVAGTVWTSDVDGRLGSGQVLDVSLTPGRHRLTLTVPDGLGGTTRRSVYVDVDGDRQEVEGEPPAGRMSRG